MCYKHSVGSSIILLIYIFRKAHLQHILSYLALYNLHIIRYLIGRFSAHESDTRSSATAVKFKVAGTGLQDAGIL